MHNSKKWFDSKRISEQIRHILTVDKDNKSLVRDCVEKSYDEFAIENIYNTPIVNNDSILYTPLYCNVFMFKRYH